MARVITPCKHQNTEKSGFPLCDGSHIKLSLMACQYFNTYVILYNITEKKGENKIARA
jgi:hypothetical protein